MPNSIKGDTYTKEYKGEDALTIPRGAVKPGMRIILIDDLVATGGTLCAAYVPVNRCCVGRCDICLTPTPRAPHSFSRMSLVKHCGGVVLECACVVELKFLNARANFTARGHGDIPTWALVDESMLTLDGLKDPRIDSTNYTDDGAPH